MKKNKKLSLLRSQIDKTDEKIIDLLAQRMKIVEQIGRVKKLLDLPALDSKRWQQVLQSRKSQASGLGLDPLLIEQIYNLIHQRALTIEKQK